MSPALPALAAAFTPADVDLLAISPMLVVFGAGFVGILLEAFAPRHLRHVTQVALAAAALVVALVVLLVRSADITGVSLSGAIVMDGPAIILQAIVVLAALLAILIMAERFSGRIADAFTPSGASVPGSPQEALAEQRGSTTEVFPLALFSVGGMMLFPAAGDLLTMFIALEILSLPLYVLTGLARRRRLLSQEGALKYFLLGSFSSAFFLFGSALLYGYAGSVNLGEIAAAVGTVSGRDALLSTGALLVLIGLLFKVGAVPFHSWIPDVYQGAPTPVTGLMAACTKVAAFGALLRVAYVAVGAARWEWQAAVAVVAALTMIVGSVLSVTQRDIKRLLAYSSIAHAGFVLVGVLAFDRAGVSAVTFYLIAYALMTIAAFGLVMLVRARGTEATHIGQWSGLGRQAPIVAGAMALLLMAFAGIPLTSGFTAKFAVFGAAVGHAGALGAVLAVIGVLCSVITAYVYFRIIVLMFFAEPEQAGVSVAVPSVLTSAAIAFGVVATVVLGVFPAPVLDMAASSALFLR